MQKEVGQKLWSSALCQCSSVAKNGAFNRSKQATKLSTMVSNTIETMPRVDSSTGMKVTPTLAVSVMGTEIKNRTWNPPRTNVGAYLPTQRCELTYQMCMFHGSMV